MTFTLLDLREMYDKPEVLRIMAVIHGAVHNIDPRIKAGTNVLYLPFKTKSGKMSTQRQSLSRFDLDILTELYENRLVSENHKHTFKRTRRYLDIMLEIKSYLESKKEK